MWIPQTVNLVYSLAGNVVSCVIPDLVGTIGSTDSFITATAVIPSRFCPDLIVVVIYPNGNVQIGPADAFETGFTSSHTGGMYSATLSWSTY